VVALFKFAAPFLGLLLLCSFFIIPGSSTWGDAVSFLFLGTIFMSWITIWLLPVRCQATGCNGRMNKDSNSISAGVFEVVYRCRVCGATEEAVILDFNL
jgi:hypothetical protein